MKKSSSIWLISVIVTSNIFLAGTLSTEGSNIYSQGPSGPLKEQFLSQEDNRNPGDELLMAYEEAKENLLILQARLKEYHAVHDGTWFQSDNPEEINGALNVNVDFGKWSYIVDAPPNLVTAVSLDPALTNTILVAPLSGDPQCFGDGCYQF